jgi:hypothetical protein
VGFIGNKQSERASHSTEEQARTSDISGVISALLREKLMDVDSVFYGRVRVDLVAESHKIFDSLIKDVTHNHSEKMKIFAQYLKGVNSVKLP